MSEMNARVRKTFECHAGDDCWHCSIVPGFFVEDPTPGIHDKYEDAKWCSDRHLRWQSERDVVDARFRVIVSDC